MEPTWQDQLDQLLARATRLRSEGDRSGAARLLDSAPELIRAFGSWKYARGSLAFEAGDLPTAVKQLEAAVEREPEVPEFRANLGAVLLEQGRQGDWHALRRAREVLEQACRDEPKLPHSHTNLGTAKLALEEVEGALACFDRALAMDPTHLPSLYNRGAALKRLGRLQESLATVDRLLSLDPKFQAAIDARKGLVAQLEAAPR